MGDHDEERQATLKAQIIGLDVRPSGALQDTDEELASLFSSHGVLEPAYDPTSLVRIWENSSALNQNIQSYVTNIDGLGYRLQPRIDLNSDESFEKVRDAMWIERIRAAERGILEDNARAADATERLDDPEAEDPVEPPQDDAAVDDPLALMPTDEEVSARIEKLKITMRLEAAKLRAFLEAVSTTGSFATLRRQTREDREITGNAYWEVLRDRSGNVARFVLVPPTHVRVTAIDEQPTVVEEKVRVGLGFETVSQPRFFRRYVQAVGRRVVWFKAFGDPRVVSQQTGKIYPDLETFRQATAKPGLREDEEPELPATELIHFRIHRTGEAYGVPRWIGNLLSVLGSRAADEVNHAYFDNKGVPPMALLVSGGRLAADSVDKIETYIRDNIKGRNNFHKILVIEADDEGDPLTPREHPKITIEKLTDAQQGDALFQKYDERNIDKIGSSFRLPRLLRGDVRDFNRSTADASLRFADEQVFEPERVEFDGWFNRTVLPEIGVSLWDLRSNGPQTRDPEKIAEIVLGLTKAGVLTPNEARELSSDVVGLDLETVEAGWAKQPIQLTLAGFLPPQDGPSGEGEEKRGKDWQRAAELRSLTTEALGEAARNNALEEAGGEGAAEAAVEVLDAAASRHGEDLLEEGVTDDH